MIVADSAPLIYMGRLGQLGVLRRLYGNIVIPEGVLEEVAGDAERPGATEVKNGVDEGWIIVRKVGVPPILNRAGAVGVDGEVLALAKRDALPLLTNDRVLAALARAQGVTVKWLTQAVIEAVAQRMLSGSEARALLRDLVRSGLRVRSEVLAEVVHLIDRSATAAK
ncbi:hypothetical protein E6H16_03145 [Candidatus Bathyarchaeota archaeon]|nr:MAG: hypothetical protein E6H16_03145 [Candidatus Bathyarchaeota archaeon]